MHDTSSSKLASPVYFEVNILFKEDYFAFLRVSLFKYSVHAFIFNIYFC